MNWRFARLPWNIEKYPWWRLQRQNTWQRWGPLVGSCIPLQYNLMLSLAVGIPRSPSSPSSPSSLPSSPWSWDNNYQLQSWHHSMFGRLCQAESHQAGQGYLMVMIRVLVLLLMVVIMIVIVNAWWWYWCRWWCHIQWMQIYLKSWGRGRFGKRPDCSREIFFGTFP